MQSLFREVHPPTAVDSALVCNFVNPRDENIVVSTASELQVYRVNGDVSSGPDRNSSETKLECLVSFSLAEKVVSMEAVRVEGASDHLLLGFRAAKLSLVRFDEETRDLRTSSLHCYENDRRGCVDLDPPEGLPLVRCDGESRCSAVLIFDGKLAVLPFVRRRKRSPVEYSYVVDLADVDSGMRNVIDFRFLHGFRQPALAVLCEPMPTWSGRIEARRDTCAVFVVSLNVERQTTAVISRVRGLPFDSFRLLQVPGPLGGVLSFAANSLIYLDQGRPSSGVPFNVFGRATTDFHLKVGEEEETTMMTMDASLDCCQACFVGSDRLVVSLKEGRMLIVTLIVDGASAVRGFRFERSVISVVATCLCPVGGGHLFVGSRLGNSILVKMTEKRVEGSEENNAIDDVKEEEDDAEEVELYGRRPTAADRRTKIEFELCDSIVNIGPCGHTIIGRTENVPEEFADDVHSSVEIVTTSGYGKSGAISVLRRSIRPQVVFTFKMCDYFDLWTLKSRSEDNAEAELESLIVLGGPNSSTVIRAGEAITELEDTGFRTEEPTVFTGNVDGNRFIVQVSRGEVRLLDGTRCIQRVPLSQEVVSCSLAVRYLALLTKTGEVSVMFLEQTENENFPELRPCASASLKEVQAMSMYHDESGLFCCKAFSAPVEQEDDDVQTMDEEDYLYGTEADKPLPHQTVTDPTPDCEEPTYWLVSCQNKGDLLMHSVPDFELKFRTRNFGSGRSVLVNSIPGGDDLLKESDDASNNHGRVSVEELLLVGMGNKNSRPHLMAVVDQALMIYETYRFFAPSVEPLVQVRFKKVSHGLIARRADVGAHDEKVRLLRRFENVGAGLSGVFLCGFHPHWVFMTSRGVLRLHPMLVDGPVTGLAPIDNSVCPGGFVYFNSKGDLTLSVLQSSLNYDSHWPILKIPLRSTPYHVTHFLEKNVYAVSTASVGPCRSLPRKTEDEEVEFKTAERVENFVHPSLERFSLQFYSASTWEPLTHCAFELEEFERVTCLKVVTLRSNSAASGFKELLVCGTTYALGEDVQGRGRILVMDIIHVVPEPGAPLTCYKLRLEFSTQLKGGVSAVAEIDSALAVAVDQSIRTYWMRDGDLSLVNEINARMHVQSMVAIKNFLFVSDVLQSCMVFKNYENSQLLSLVSRDTKPKEIYSLEFLASGGSLHFLVTDSNKNLLAYSTQPELRESMYGQNLMQTSCFRLESHVNSMFRIRCARAGIDGDPFEFSHTTYLSTLDGGIGYLTPLPSKMYRRLLILQTLMSRKMPHNALLNPKSSRYSDCTMRQQILDGDLVFRFHELGLAEKRKLAKESFSQLEDILNDLTSLELSTSHF